MSRLMGKVVIKTLGFRVAYYLTYFRDRKALIKELQKGVDQESGGKQMQETTKIAIIFIGTNKYIEFFPGYYETIKRKFLTNTPKDFFVFTDMVDYPFLAGKDDVITVPVEHQKWPFSTLMRFKMMNKASEKLEDYSHIIYIDGDMYASSVVTEDEFFSHDKPLFGVKHICYVTKMGEFEMNPRSTAGVSRSDDLSDYHAGTFFGGKGDAILELIKELDRRVDIDLENGIVAKWHDESQLNKYFVERKHLVRTLDPSYIYSELKPIPRQFKSKFIHMIHSSIKTSTANRNEPNNPYEKSR